VEEITAVVGTSHLVVIVLGAMNQSLDVRTVVEIGLILKSKVTVLLNGALVPTMLTAVAPLQFALEAVFGTSNVSKEFCCHLYFRYRSQIRIVEESHFPGNQTLFEKIGQPAIKLGCIL
jgi:hypothetical protein